VSRIRWIKPNSNKDSKQVESRAHAHCIGKEWWIRNCELFCVLMHSFFSLKWVKHYLSMQNFNHILIPRFSFQLTDFLFNSQIIYATNVLKHSSLQSCYPNPFKCSMTYDRCKWFNSKTIGKKKKETKKQDTTIGNQSMLGQCSENLIAEAYHTKTAIQNWYSRTEFMTEQQVAISMITIWENSSCNSINYMAKLNLRLEEN